MEQRRTAGTLAESIAALFLQLQGIEVLQRNIACAGVEVDLLARQGTCLLIVEVKLRKPSDRFSALQALGAPQRRRLRRAAGWTLERCLWARSVRIDVVGVSSRVGATRLVIEHLRGVE